MQEEMLTRKFYICIKFHISGDDKSEEKFQGEKMNLCSNMPPSVSHSDSLNLSRRTCYFSQQKPTHIFLMGKYIFYSFKSI